MLYVYLYDAILLDFKFTMPFMCDKYIRLSTNECVMTRTVNARRLGFHVKINIQTPFLWRKNMSELHSSRVWVNSFWHSPLLKEKGTESIRANK